MTLWNENAATFASTGEQRAAQEANQGRRAWLERIRVRDLDAACYIAVTSVERQALFLGVGRVEIPILTGAGR